MKLNVQYGTKNLAFSVEFRERKTLEICVEPPEKIHVVAPTGTSEDEIIKYVKRKADWIVQKLFLFKGMAYRSLHREVVNGEAFMYLGRNYALQLIDGEAQQVDGAQQGVGKKALSEVKLFQGKLHVATATRDEQKIKQALEAWYRKKTLEKVNERVRYYQHYFKLMPKAVKVKEQQKRWGSCTSNLELLFNWRCVMAPSHVLDYIVVHEMCHMVHMNHSREFWDLLSAIMPDYERRKDWLKNNGVKMGL